MVIEVDKGIAPPTRTKERAEVRTDNRERRRRLPGFVDKYHIPEELKPAGLSIEWKRFETFGQPDPAYMANLHMNGWESLKAEDYPELAAALGVSKGTIIRDGLMLMERPQALTDEARVEDNNAAKEAIRAKEEQLTGRTQGILERTSGQVQRHYGPVEVPND